jgi:hypothetical protein
VGRVGHQVAIAVARAQGHFSQQGLTQFERDWRDLFAGRSGAKAAR